MTKLSPSANNMNVVTMKVPRGFEKLTKKEQIAYLKRLQQLQQGGGAPTSNPVSINSSSPRSPNSPGRRYQSSPKQQQQQQLFL